MVEGFVHCIGRGVPYAYQGAQMACKQNCKIADGFSRRTWNGQQFVIHGMKTSGGCPLISTLNDIDGVGNERGEAVAIRFVLNDEGEWVGKTNEGYEQQFLLTDEQTGEPLPNRHYRMTFKGMVTEGKSDAEGKTQKVIADDPAEVSIEILPEGYFGATR